MLSKCTLKCKLIGLFSLIIPGNFLIYCSIMPPFKKAMSRVCTFLCFWKSTTCCVAASPLERRANSPDQTETLLPTTTLNGGTGKDFSNWMSKVSHDISTRIFLRLSWQKDSVSYLGTIQVLRHHVFDFFRPTQPTLWWITVL